MMDEMIGKANDSLNNSVKLEIVLFQSCFARVLESRTHDHSIRMINSDFEVQVERNNGIVAL